MFGKSEKMNPMQPSRNRHIAVNTKPSAENATTGSARLEEEAFVLVEVGVWVCKRWLVGCDDVM